MQLELCNTVSPTSTKCCKIFVQIEGKKSLRFRSGSFVASTQISGEILILTISDTLPCAALSIWAACNKLLVYVFVYLFICSLLRLLYLFFVGVFVRLIVVRPSDS